MASGTNPSFLFSKYLIEEKKVTDFRARSLLTRLSLNIKESSETLFNEFYVSLIISIILKAQNCHLNEFSIHEYINSNFAPVMRFRNPINSRERVICHSVHSSAKNALIATKHILNIFTVIIETIIKYQIILNITVIQKSPPNTSRFVFRRYYTTFALTKSKIF